jgi:DNA-binding NarL/FixJ family response regulator
MSQHALPMVSLIVVDLDLPVLDGIEGLRRLHREHPDRIVIVLSESEERETVLAYLSAGAQGYTLKTANATQILRAIDTVLDGSMHAPASFQIAAVPGFGRLPPLEIGNGALPQLTDRQRDVFRLLQEGCATKAIASRLDLAVGTVKIHLAGIYRAWGARSRMEAIAFARRAEGNALA